MGRNLVTVWLDYRKALDSIPQSWLLHALNSQSFQTIYSRQLKTELNHGIQNLTLMARMTP